MVPNPRTAVVHHPAPNSHNTANPSSTLENANGVQVAHTVTGVRLILTNGKQTTKPHEDALRRTRRSEMSPTGRALTIWGMCVG